MTLLFFLLATLIFGGISYRLKWLSASGSVVASAFGFCLLWLGGWPWVVPLILFFGTSSILSKIGKKTSIDPPTDKKNDHIRNATQVLANGGVAWLLLIIYAVTAQSFWYAGFVGSLAAATADTWATEIGRLAGGQPRSILNGRILDKGLSGGITWQGTAGSAVGGLLIGLSCVPFYDNPLYQCTMIGVVSGMAGSIFDSVIGATLQVKYQASGSNAIIEKVEEGVNAQKISGLSWVNNDVVNICCTVVGGSVALLLEYLFR